MSNHDDLMRTLFGTMRPAATRCSAVRGAPIVFVLALLLAPVPSAAQSPDRSPDPEQAAEILADQAAEEIPSPESETGQAEEDLRARIDESYEVLPVRDGVLLQPREDYRGVRAIEIGGDSIAINGEDVPEEAVRGWLGSRADEILALAALAPEERRALFGLTGTTQPEEGEESEAEPADAREVAEPDQSAPAPPAPPEPPERRVRRGSQTGFGSSVYVARDEEVDDVVVLGGSVTVDGVVDGDAVVLGGRLEINGEVENDAVIIGGSMHLGPHSEVGGDVAIVGGSLHREPGARIGGSVEQVERGWGFPVVSPALWRPGWHGWSPWHQMGELFWAIGSLVLCGLLIAMVLALGRTGIENLSRRIGLEPFKAGLVGLLITVLLVPVLTVVSALLIISIIGIPIFVILLLGFIFVGVPALMVIGLVGYTAVSHRIGHWLAGRFGWSLQNPFAEAFVGLLALYALILIGRILGLLGGPVDFFAAMFVLTGWAAQVTAGLVGFGAVFLRLWERRSGGPGRQALTAPPPSPPPAGADANEPAEEPPPGGSEARGGEDS